MTFGWFVDLKFWLARLVIFGRFDLQCWQVDGVVLPSHLTNPSKGGYKLTMLE